VFTTQTSIPSFALTTKLLPLVRKHEIEVIVLFKIAFYLRKPEKHKELAGHGRRLARVILFASKTERHHTGMAKLFAMKHAKG